jgi:hypothetical protein
MTPNAPDESPRYEKRAWWVCGAMTSRAIGRSSNDCTRGKAWLSQRNYLSRIVLLTVSPMT